MRENRDEAMAEFERALKIAPNTPDFIAMIGYTRAVAGRRDQARRCLAQLDELALSRYVPPFCYGTIYAALGEPDLAFKWMEKGREDRDPRVRALKTDPLFDALRADPRFAGLMRRAGLTT
jgi:tetratricopeptide (TPR) repeat protein